MTTASPPAPQSPRALIVTLFGLYVRELGGWISVSRLIDLMGHVGIEPPPVRSSVSRLKKRGVLASERRGGVAGYALSEYGESVLAEGDRRIFVREEPHSGPRTKRGAGSVRSPTRARPFCEPPTVNCEP